MVISLTHLIMVGLFFLVVYLVGVILDLRKKVQKPETVYIDTSGIDSNPPKMLETWQNKTINIKVTDKVCVSIPHFKALDCIRYIKEIADYYKILLEKLEIEHKNKSQKLIGDLQYMVAYRQLCAWIYKLSKQFSNNKWKFKRAFFKRVKADFNFILNVSEEVLDYWSFVKKKLIFLASETTDRQKQMDGKASILSYSIKDGRLMSSIKPRFG